MTYVEKNASVNKLIGLGILKILNSRMLLIRTSVSEVTIRR